MRILMFMALFVLSACKTEVSGPPPTTGDEISVVTNYKCSKVVPTNGFNMIFTYEYTQFSSGFSGIVCTIEYRAYFRSRTRFVVLGSSDSGCEIGHDLDNDNTEGGTWLFGTSNIVIYVDPSSALDGTTVDFLADDCL